MKVKVREEHLRHPTVAFPPAHLNLGVLGLKMWQRPEQPVAPERHRNPLAEKERARWREGSQLACRSSSAVPRCSSCTWWIGQGRCTSGVWRCCGVCLGHGRRASSERHVIRRIATGYEPRSW